MDIFLLFCGKESYQLRQDAQNKILKLIEELYATRDKNFGNGRTVRNLFQKILRLQANRLILKTELSREDLLYLEATDIPDSIDVVEQI